MYKHTLVTLCTTDKLANILVYELHSKDKSLMKNTFLYCIRVKKLYIFLAFERYPMTDLFSELSLSIFFCRLLLLQLLNLDYILPLLLPGFSLQTLHLRFHILQAGFLLGQWSLQLLNMTLQGTVGLNQSCNNSISLKNMQEDILYIKKFHVLWVYCIYTV